MCKEELQLNLIYLSSEARRDKCVRVSRAAPEIAFNAPLCVAMSIQSWAEGAKCETDPPRTLVARNSIGVTERNVSSETEALAVAVGYFKILIIYFNI